jgi:ATP-dependent helicase/nuclease subunit B
LELSPSSFEKYVKCPFNYFCSNVLNLREKKDSVFKSNDAGTFVHYILEILIKNAIPQDPKDPIPDDETLIELANKTVEAYISRICPPALIDSKRLSHLYSRLKNIALLVVRNTVKEFSASDFRPVFYELRVDGKDGHPSPLIFKLADDSEVCFTGIVDRVDLYRSGDEVYIRVVDYKTGAKTFSLKDLDAGINMQMLIYLFSLCRSKSPDFKKAVGIPEDKNAIPAGVMYLSSHIKMIEATDYDVEDSITETAENSLSRTGLLLHDEDILRAMNHALDSKFLANIKYKEKEDVFTGEALVSNDGFTDILKKLEDTVVKIATELHSGKADANPLIYNKKSPCDYCQAKPVCRKAE